MDARVWPDVCPELRDVHVEHTLILSDAGSSAIMIGLLLPDVVRSFAEMTGS